MLDLENVWTDFECPKCGYSIEIRLIEAKTESTVPCYCCKTWIKLIDHEGSTHVGISSINSAVNELERMLKNFGK